MKRLLLPLALLALPRLAAAQQPMIDPSQMSGIPRPDAAMKAGSLSVRVLRGDFAHSLVGHEVTLDGPGGPRTIKTDDTSRAVFEGLTTGRGAYVVKASGFGEDLASQPIEMPPSPGVKIMLVFKRDEKALLGEADGVARADERLPPGSIEVKVVDGDDKPLAGVRVILAHGTREGDKVDEKRVTTDGEGRARFEMLAITERDGYVVSAQRDGSSPTTSKPFQLDAKSGVLVALRSVPVTRDPKVVTIGKRSHVIVEVRDDVVEVVENWTFENSSSSPFDPGPEGITIELPSDAEGAQLGPEPPAGLTIEGNRARWKKPLPPGETAMTVAFVLKQHGSAVTLRQTMPFDLDVFAMILDRFDGMEIEGAGIEKTERTMGGRTFWVVRGPAVKAGAAVEVTLRGLPHRSTLPRDLAVGAAALIAAWGLFWSLGRRGDATSRVKLEQRRVDLLERLAALDEKGVSGKPRDDLVARLERVYRELDETGT